MLAARLIFVFDATASHQPTWDIACQILSIPPFAEYCRGCSRRDRVAEIVQDRRHVDPGVRGPNGITPRARLRRWQSAPLDGVFGVPLRESFREDGRVRQRTLTNLSAWSTGLIEVFARRRKAVSRSPRTGIRVRSALPDGHAAAMLGTIRAISLDGLLGKPTNKCLAALAIASIAAIWSHPPPSSPPRASLPPTRRRRHIAPGARFAVAKDSRERDINLRIG